MSSRVSNATHMSRAVRIVIFPESMVSMSLVEQPQWNEICDRQIARCRNWEIWNSALDGLKSSLVMFIRESMSEKVVESISSEEGIINVIQYNVM